MPHFPITPIRTLQGAPVFLLSGVLLASACAPAGTPGNAENAATVAMSDTQAAAPSSQSGEWEMLFDGADLNSWRGFQRQDVPGSWRAENGTLAFSPVQDTTQRGDIMTREQYGDFELELEWKISEAGNSGIMYRVSEEERYPWFTGPEMQVLDDAGHPDGQIPSHRAGALYDLIVPPDNVARPVGEWNQARVVVRGNHIQQWLNGQQTADIEIGSEEWNQRMAKSKFREIPSFATKREGHIALQDHNDPVWYRNIRIRQLDGGR